MRRVQAEAVGHADGFFVEPFQFGVRHVLNLGCLVQQFAIEQFPAQRFGQFPGDLAAPGAILAGDGDDVHATCSKEGQKTVPTTKSSWRGLDVRPRCPYQKQILKVGVISSVDQRYV